MTERGPETNGAGTDIAIVGMACTFPGARDLRAFWHNIVGGIDCTTEVPPQRWDAELFYDPDPTNLDRVYCKRGGYLPPTFAFNPARYGTMPKAVSGAEPDQFLVLRCAHEAMEDAGLLNRPLDGRRASFVLGRGNYLGAGLTALLQRGQLCEQTLAILRQVRPDLSPQELAEIREKLRGEVPLHGAETAPGLIPNITTGRTANRLDLMGPNYCVDAACASSLVATELAVLDLVSRRCDLALAGGVHIFTGVPFLQVFAAMGALSHSGMIRPFDRGCDGTLSGEGVGVLVLKRLADAERDGDRIYALIKGVGTSSDGRAMSVAAPRVEGEELALRRAYENSGIDPRTVGLIECHGTGTTIGDATEVEALHRVFGSAEKGAPACALGTIKSMIGHAMPAAGVAGLIKTALALYHGVLPATLNCRAPLEPITRAGSRFYVNGMTRPWIHGARGVPRRAGVSAFGFGGINAHVVLEAYAPQVEARSLRPGDEASRRPTAAPALAAPETLLCDWDCELVVVEGDSREALRDEALRLSSYLRSARGVALRDVAYTCNTSLSGPPHRLAVVGASLAEVAQKLDRAAERLADADCKQIKDGQGAYYFGGSPVCGGRLAFLFPGEGAQYVNMLSDLCIHFPEVRGCFEAADRAVSRPDRRPPSGDIFPPPFFSDAEREEAEARLWRIERATEGVLTADGAMYTLLSRLGVKAHFVAGHSAGEWIALAAAGVVDIDEFVGSMDRLDAMYRKLAEDVTIPRKAMLAVGAGRDKVLSLTGQIDRPVHIANDNCPHQVVIVVDQEDAEAVAKHLRASGVFVERLPYDRGYHTPAFTYICEPLRSYFSALAVRPAATALYSCTTGEPYPQEREEILDLVANTFARPLLFRDTVEAMYEAGARIFLEVGPRGNLTAFVDDILRGRPHAAVAMDQPRRSGTAALNHALGQLAALGVAMDLGPLYERRSVRRLQFDPQADAIEDPDSAPGTMQVSICYPSLSLKEPVPLPEGGEVAPEPPEAPIALPAGPAASGAEGSLPSGSSSGVMQQHFETMESFLRTQEDVMRAYLGKEGGRPAPQRESDAGAPGGPVSPSTAGEEGAIASVSALEAEESAGDAEEFEVGANAGAEVQEPVVAPPRLQEMLISIVSDKTGYPPEMLDLDSDLEADLGIDSIKRIEILGALQETAGEALAAEQLDMEEVARLKSLREVVAFLEGLATGGAEAGAASPSEQSGEVDTSRLPLSGRVVRHVPGREVVVVRRVDLAEDLYLADHCLDPPASDYEPPRHAMPVVPLTVSVEMMAEAALLLRPGCKVVGARQVQAGRWINVDPDIGSATIAITARCDEDGGEVEVKIAAWDDSAGEPTGGAFVSGRIVLGDAYPSERPKPEIALRNGRAPSHTAGEMYAKRRMFHGPRFQGVASLDAISEDGVAATLEVLPRDDLLAGNASPRFVLDPFLMDAAGQLVGYWPVEQLKDGFVMFPIRIGELTVYRENPPPGRKAKCRFSVREVSPRQLRADLDIVDEDGRAWMRIEGWEDWRFYWAPGFYDFWRFPNKGALSERLEVFSIEACEDVECRRLAPSDEMRAPLWQNLWVRVILSRGELAQYRAIASEKRRAQWLYGRAAAKDAVRAWVNRHCGLELYPADVEISTDEDGRPVVSGPWTHSVEAVPQVSISHKGTTAVAAAGRLGVGIDLEQIKPREKGFEDIAFTADERDVLHQVDSEDRAEWITRAWCAKEAASKAIGSGFSNGPATMVVTQVDDGAGTVTVVCGAPLRRARPELTDREFAVHTMREGDFVVALAVEGRNVDAGV